MSISILKAKRALDAEIMKATENAASDFAHGRNKGWSLHTNKADCLHRKTYMETYEYLEAAQKPQESETAGNGDETTAKLEQRLEGLIDGLKDMIERGVLSESLQPDDFQWIEHQIEKAEELL